MIENSELIGTKVPAPWGWREFKVGDLFQVIVGNRQDMSSSGKYPLIKAKTGDNGYAGFADTCDLAVGLTIGMRGSFNVYVQKSPVALGTNTAGLVLKDDSISDTRVLIYLGTMLHRENYEGSSGYVGYPTLKRLTQIDTMLLPVTQDGQPDYGWMASYIRELENQRIRELDTYLQVTGLDDTTLTDNELQVLEQWRQHEKFGRGTLLTKRFLVTDLFDCISIPQIPKYVDLQKGDIPYVTQTEVNNGVKQYIKSTDDLQLNVKKGIVFGVDTQVVYYQEKPFYANKMIQLVFKHDATKLHYLFVMSLLKAQFRKYNYNNKLSLTRLKDTELELPVANDGTPDYDFIETFIRAQEKLVMKRLDKFRQLQIDTTKAVI